MVTVELDRLVSEWKTPLVHGRLDDHLMNLQEFRERVNAGLYNSKDSVLGGLKFLNLLVSASALFVLALYYGFPNESETASQLLSFVKFSLGFTSCNMSPASCTISNPESS